MTSAAEPAPPRRPRIVHIVHRFDVGGMENGLVNLVNRLPASFAEHCIVALTDANPEFCQRLERVDARVLALHRPPGQLLLFLPALVRLFRQLEPDVVHTRNVGTLEAQLAAWACAVPVRVHGEHGWDVGDLAGENRRMLWLRRMMRPFVHHQIALSEPTHRYLAERVGVPESKITNICNGVDTVRFAPPTDVARVRAELCASDPAAARALGPDAFLVGAVGRLAEVKNLPMLLDAFAALRARAPDFHRAGRLAIVGDGPLRERMPAMLAQRGLVDVTWLAGARGDIPRCLGALDLLCLPSLAEGISNAILEAMACGVPVVATDVGGNRELVCDGECGGLVASQDVVALSERIEHCFRDPRARERAGLAARERAVTQFSIETMIAKYHRVYCTQLERAGWHPSTRLDAVGPAGNS